MTQDWPVVIVGIGNLGQALANYSGFRSRGFRVVALLDADPDRRDEVVAGVDVRAFDDLEQIVREHGVAIGVIATPAVAAQDVADRMVACGITSILNFAPTVLVGARAGRRPQGRPLHRAADPRLPRAAQGPRRAATGMSVLVVGISHKSAPVSLLERVALDADGVHKLIDDVAACEHVTEATVIATCNRLEIYADVDRFHGSVEERLPAARRAGRRVAPRRCCRTSTSTTTTAPSPTSSRSPPASTRWRSARARSSARPATRCGSARSIGTVGPALNVLFQQALRVGKRARAPRPTSTAPRRPWSGRPRPHPARRRRPRRQAGAGPRRRRDGRPRHRHRVAARRRRASPSPTAPPTTPTASPREYGARSAPLADLAAELAPRRRGHLLHRRHRRARHRAPWSQAARRRAAATARDHRPRAARTTSTPRSPTCPASP